MAQANVNVNWFEIPVADVARAATFYNTVLGIEMAEIPGPGGEPLQVFMGAEGPSGALMQGESYTPNALEGTLIYLGCDDIEPLLSRVAAAGGSVLMERTSIGEYGAIGMFIDSEGNRVGLHSAS